MALGDVTFFDEAKAYMIDGGWESADTIKCAILDNTVAPVAGASSPALGTYTQVGSGGTYVAGGESLGTWGDFVSEEGGTVTFDSATNPSWAQDGSNDNDAYWGLIYNNTQAGAPALAFVDLDGPKDMSTGSLQITWDDLGVATLT